MLSPRFATVVVAVCILVLGVDIVCGQTYPSKPVRIVTAASGGGADLISRIIALGLAGPLGQQVIVDNQRNGVIPGEVTAKAPPDGYTLMLIGSSVWLAPFLQDRIPFDPGRDFASVTLAVNSPSILLVHPTLPVKSVKELITLAKARPGELNFAAGSRGSAPYLGSELFKKMTGINVVHIYYRGNGPALVDLMGGHVQAMITSMATAGQYIKSGRLRPLAVTTAKPTPLAPELPTVAAAAGLPGYESAGIFGLFAPAGTPAAIINRLNQESTRFLVMPETRARIATSGIESIGGPPEQLTNAVKSEMTVLGKLIKDLGIREE